MACKCFINYNTADIRMPWWDTRAAGVAEHLLILRMCEMLVIPIWNYSSHLLKKPQKGIHARKLMSIKSLIFPDTTIKGFPNLLGT